MKLGYVILYIADVGQTLSFYEKAFGLTRKFLHESGMYGELETGSTTLSFAAEGMAEMNGFDVRPNKPAELPAGAELAFVTEDVNAAYTKALATGAIDCKAPTQKPWGQTVAYVRDINGFLVEICTPIQA